MNLKRGRPKLYITDEQRAEAQKRYREKNAGKTKNVTLDADLVESINGIADKLAAGFGFRPTLSQTVRYLIKKMDHQ